MHASDCAYLLLYNLLYRLTLSVRTAWPRSRHPVGLPFGDDLRTEADDNAIK